MLSLRSRLLTDSQLKCLAGHKYCSTSASLLDPLLQPWWNFLAARLPLWVAPNLITVVGLLINLATSLVLVWCSPDALTEPPGWACLLCALGLFAYQSLDAVDGKQARRTRTSSPLGELVDHGCDSVSAVLIIVAACVSLRLGVHPPLMLAASLAGLTAFYGAHWRAYLTGGLRFCALDVTETQCGIVVVHLVSAVLGTSAWTDNTLPWLGCPLAHAMCACAFAGTIALLGQGLVEIYASEKWKKGSIFKGTSVFSPGIPYLLAVLPACALAGGVVYVTNPALYLLAHGLVVAKATVRLVVAHMTRSPLGWLDSAMVGPAALLLHGYTGTALLSERAVLWFSLLWSVVDLIGYSWLVCRQICDHLGLRLFHIPYTTPFGDGLTTNTPLQNALKTTTPLEVKTKTTTPLMDISYPTTPHGVGFRTTPLRDGPYSTKSLEDELNKTKPLEGKLKTTTPLGDGPYTTMPLEVKLKTTTPLEDKTRTNTPLGDGPYSTTPLEYKLKTTTPLENIPKTMALLGDAPYLTTPTKDGSYSTNPLEDDLKTTTPLQRKQKTTTPLGDGPYTSTPLVDKTKTMTHLGDGPYLTTPLRDELQGP